MAIPNLDSLVVVVHLFGDLASVTSALPENSGRRLPKSAGEIALFNQITVEHGDIALYLNQQPNDITKGFMFGSDPRSCDVLLANTKDTGISANHFSIHIDWVSRDPMITCLSGNKLQVKVTDTRTTQYLAKKEWRNMRPGTTTNVHVTNALGVSLFNPVRGNLQAAYNRNLQDYFLEFKHSVPELANISLRDEEVTPLILDRCAGLEGKEYYTTGRIETGDPIHDTKVFLYDAKFKPTPDALATTQEVAVINNKEPNHFLDAKDIEDWILQESEGGRPGEICVVKHFRDKKNLSNLPSRFPELCCLSHFNIEEFLDLITETSVFMTVTEPFSRTTLHALHQEEPLNTIEAGFVLGQTLAALEYLHNRQWTHGNLDPRSIHVMSRKHLWIKLTDIALSDYVDLGKPNGYHDTYASQRSSQADKSPADIWSAGVVALHLLFPYDFPPRNNNEQNKWVLKLARFAAGRNRKYSNDATAFVQRVLRHDSDERPTATEALEHPWILQNRRESPVDSPHYSFPTPQVSCHTGVGPSDASSRQGSAATSNSSIHGDFAPGSRHTSAGPSRRSSTQGSSTRLRSTAVEDYASGSRHTSVGASRRHSSVASSNNATGGLHHQNYDPTSRAASKSLSRQSSTDPTIRALLESRPYPGDDYNDFESENRSTTSRNSRFTANSLARLARAPTPSESDDNKSAPVGQRSLRSQSRSNGGRSPAIQSEHASTASQSSRFTANPLAREPHLTRIPYDSEDESGMPGSLRSQPRNSGRRSPAEHNKHGGPGPLRSQPRSGRGKSPLSDWATGTFGRVEGQGEAVIEEDSGEETATDERRGRVTKKPRRDAVVPPLERNLRWRGNGRR